MGLCMSRAGCAGFPGILAGVILLFASPVSAAETPKPDELRGPELGFVDMCHRGDATPEEIAATEAAAIAAGYRPRPHRARPLDRISRTATQPGGVAFGRGYTITWGYLRDGFVIPENTAFAIGSEPSSLFERLNQLHPGGFDEWHAKFVDVFSEWAAVTGNRYVYESEDDGAPLNTGPGVLGQRADIRIGMRVLHGSFSAYNYYPPQGSDMVLGRNLPWQIPDYFRSVVLHEHGHGLGLYHVCPMNGTKLMEPSVSIGTRATLDDILGAQSLYGDALNHATEAVGSFRRSRQLILGVDEGGVDEYLLDRPGTFVVGARPLGARYPEGPEIGNECGPGTLIDTEAYGDLTVQLLDASGNLLLDRNAQPAGSSERATVRLRPEHLPARVRVGNASGNYQMYQLIAGKWIAPVAPPPSRDLFRDGFEQ